MCNMNLTLSIDDQLVERAREVARLQGTSLQELLRAYVATLGGQGQRNGYRGEHE